MKRNQCISDVTETNFSLTAVDVVHRNMDKTVENNLERPHGNDGNVLGSKSNGFQGKNGSLGKEGMDKGIVLNPLEFIRAQWNFKWTPQKRSDDSKDREMTYSNGIDKKTPLGGGASTGRVDKDGDDVKLIGDMTIARKITFAFSFIPIIMFVLLVTLLIPCNNSPQDVPCCGNNTSVIDDVVVNGTISGLMDL